MNLEKYVPKFLKLDVANVLLTDAQQKFMAERYIKHKSIAQISFENNIRYTVVKAVIERAERHIIRYAIYKGEC